jgi:hypothetical protein
MHGELNRVSIGSLAIVPRESGFPSHSQLSIGNAVLKVLDSNLSEHANTSADSREAKASRHGLPSNTWKPVNLNLKFRSLAFNGF